MRQHLLDAFADYLCVFETSEITAPSDAPALLRQLVEASAEVNRAMHVGPVLSKHIEAVLGPPPPQPADPADPAAADRYRDDLARWVMRTWLPVLEDFFKPIMGGHPMLDALHNDIDRALAGGDLHFFRPIAPPHGNRRNILRRTARDAAVYTVILAAAELDGKDRPEQVLKNATVGVSVRTFTDMRQGVDDKAALARIDEEAKRRRDNRRIRLDAARRASRSSRGRPAAPRPEKPRGLALVVEPLSDAEQLALYPEQYPDLARLNTDERIRYLFSIWHGIDG